ncbi:hypothetical protein_gp198 [Bacillus phage vB_BceM_WH1]|nr:hypothetical protein_gp198 [Bacillus phage vB_BceM_WH1]
MSMLKHVQTNRCPKCGESTVIEEKVGYSYFNGQIHIHEHVNGHRDETRRFACGQAVSYSKNFREEKLETAGYTCLRDPERIEREKQKVQLEEDVREFIKGSELPDDVKRSVAEKLYIRLED